MAPCFRKMRLPLITLGLLLIVGSRPAAAQGWTRLPNTQLRSACPPNTPEYEFSYYCQGVIEDWSGGIADTLRNRMIIWGGGHGGYFGNEIYSLNLNQGTLTRLTDPSALDPNRDCIEVHPDGKPNNRETYNGLAYIAHADRMFVFGGSLACVTGDFSDVTWTLNLATLQWTRMNPTGGTPFASPGVVADYDPNTRKVFLHDVRGGSFWQYDFDMNTYTLLSSDSFIDIHLTGVIDPTRRLFFIFGNGFAYRVDISGTDPTYTVQDISSQLISPLSGCAPLINEIYPGLAYDTAQNRIVGWAGTLVDQGNTVYVFNPDTNSCSAVTFPGGPGPQQVNGTNGRWRYFPQLRVFALVNDWEQDAFILRLTP